MVSTAYILLYQSHLNNQFSMTLFTLINSMGCYSRYNLCESDRILEPMKIELLYEFIYLTESLNFTKAAEKLNITQPVLSRHIKQLEDQLDAHLFRRDTHGVELTSVGYIFLEEAKKITNQYERSIIQINTFTGKNRKKLNITFLGEAIKNVLVEFLVVFRAQFPDIAVECRDSELDEALGYLEDRSCDIGFLIRPNFLENSRFKTLLIQKDAVCVAVNKRHPLAKLGKVSLNDVAKWPIIRVSPGEFVLSEQFSTAFLDKYNIDYTLHKEFPNIKTCCFNLDFNSEAILLMPKHRGYLISSNCKLLDVIEDDYWFEVEMVWDKDNPNPTIAPFLKLFEKYLSSMTTQPI
jgi:DNA-binding transcriptional LysR family regulator